MLHTVLVMRRAAGRAGTHPPRHGTRYLRPVLQRHGWESREMGVGDSAVPPKMQRIGEAFYGRQKAYETALAAGEQAPLAAALARNVFGTDRAPGAIWLAKYVLQCGCAIWPVRTEVSWPGQTLPFLIHAISPKEASGMTSVDHPWSIPVSLHEVPESGRSITIVADEPARAAIAKLADLRALPRLEANFDLSPRGRDGLHVVGRVAATVGQTCVVTLEPIESEIEEDVDVVFAPPSTPIYVEEDGARVEIDPVDAPEPLTGNTVDLGVLATEFFILAIDPYPRKSGVEFDPPAADKGDGHPFAALAALEEGKRDGGSPTCDQNPHGIVAPCPIEFRIALDAIGETMGPRWSVPGAELALQRHPDIEFILFGDRAVIEPLLATRPSLRGPGAPRPYRCRRQDGRQAEPGAAPGPLEEFDVACHRRGEEGRCGRRRLGRQYRRADGDGQIPSAGPCPASSVRQSPRSGRPCAAKSIVLDLGASIGADAPHLVNLAVMGSAMARVLFGIERPTVGLLNIGVEEVKGLEEVREAASILARSKLPFLNYAGFVEGDDDRQAARLMSSSPRASPAISRSRPPRAPPASSPTISRSAMRQDHLDQARLSLCAAGVPHARRQDGSAEIQRRRLSRIQRHRHQKSRRHRCRGLCYRRRYRLRHGAPRTAGEDRADALRSEPAVAPSRLAGRSNVVTVLRSVVLGCGSYLPSRVLTNGELAKQRRHVRRMDRPAYRNPRTPDRRGR